MCSVSVQFRHTFHYDLLLKDITHFCYSHAWYIQSASPQTLVAIAHYRLWMPIQRQILQIFLHSFMISSVFINANTILFSFLDFIRDFLDAYLSINLHISGGQTGGRSGWHRLPSVLMAPTDHQFPPLYLNPAESSVVTFPVNGFQEITQCPRVQSHKFAVE